MDLRASLLHNRRFISTVSSVVGRHTANFNERSAAKEVATAQEETLSSLGQERSRRISKERKQKTKDITSPVLTLEGGPDEGSVYPDVQ